MQNLDRLDRQIIHELDRDASQSMSKISKSLRLGSDLVEYRIKRLISDGVINRFSPLIDPSVMGFQIYKTYVKHRLSKSSLGTLLLAIDKDPHTYWLSEGYGRWDLVFSVAARSVSQFQTILDLHLGNHGAYILDLAVYPLVSVNRFPKHYLVGKGEEVIRWRSAEGILVLDDLEKRLLTEISNNCRMTDIELAKRLKSTPAIVNYRRKKLEDSKVILGYWVQLDYAKLGMALVKIFIEPKIFSRTLRKRILNFCRKEPRITCYIQQIGNYSLELEAEVQDYQDLTRLLEIFRDEFGSEIGHIEHMTLTNNYNHRVPE